MTADRDSAPAPHPVDRDDVAPDGAPSPRPELLARVLDGLRELPDARTPASRVPTADDEAAGAPAAAAPALLNDLAFSRETPDTAGGEAYRGGAASRRRPA